MHFHIDDKPVYRFVQQPLTIFALEQSVVDGLDVVRFVEDGGSRNEQPLVEAVGVVVEGRFLWRGRVDCYDFLLDFAERWGCVSSCVYLWRVSQRARRSRPAGKGREDALAPARRLPAARAWVRERLRDVLSLVHGAATACGEFCLEATEMLSGELSKFYRKILTACRPQRL